MASQNLLLPMLGQARLQTYLDAAAGDAARAAELYLWVTDLAGALHSQISFVELAVRNAIDPQLANWNASKGFSAAWTGAGQAAEPLYGVLRTALKNARVQASKEAGNRQVGHPRHGTAVSHDDVVAQLMFGAWVKLIRPIPTSESPARQQKLWTDALNAAFPNADSSDAGRVATGNQLETFRRLRNRVAHHDNLLEVDVTHRLNGMLSLLASINKNFADIATARMSLRRIAREDPRRNW